MVKLHGYPLGCGKFVCVCLAGLAAGALFWRLAQRAGGAMWRALMVVAVAGALAGIGMAHAGKSQPWAKVPAQMLAVASLAASGAWWLLLVKPGLVWPAGRPRQLWPEYAVMLAALVVANVAVVLAFASDEPKDGAA